MFFNGPLFHWQFRQVRWVTLIALVIALAYTLWEPSLLIRGDMLGWALLLTLVHSLLITWRLGRPRSRSFGFLYTQGYSRNAIWWHTMLASAASVLLVWLPSALAIWLGLRSHFQSDLLQNYWFPLVAPCEYSYPLWVLFLYACFLPAFHYAWIRNAQPMRGHLAGVVVATYVALVVFSLWLFMPPRLVPSVAQWLMFGGLAVTSIALEIGGWLLHRQLEVIS